MRTKKIASRKLAHPERPLRSFVICKLCGRELRIISGLHLKKVHSLTRDEYLADFNLSPDQLISEETRELKGTREEYFPFRADEVLKAIQEIYLIEGQLTASLCVKKYYSVYHQALWLFENWETALRKCGLDPDQLAAHKSWPKEKVLSIVRSRHLSDMPICGSEFFSENTGMIHAGSRYFGSWFKAIEAAGLDPEEVGVHRRWNSADVLSEIRKMGRSNKKGEFRKLSKAAARRFGSMKLAAESAGIDPDYFYGKRIWSKKKVVEAVKKRHQDGKAMNSAAVQKEDGSLMQAALHHLKTWNNALKAAGIEPKTVLTRKAWTKEIIKRELRKLLRRKEPLNDYWFIRENYNDLARAAQRYFGGWKNAAIAAGIPADKVEKQRKWTKDKVIEAVRLLRIRDTKAKIPLDLRGAAVKHFGGIREAVVAAGLDPNKFFRTRIWTKKRLIEEIRARKRRRKPLDYMTVYKEDAGLVSSARSRFGNWTKALKAAGIKM